MATRTARAADTVGPCCWGQVDPGRACARPALPHSASEERGIPGLNERAGERDTLSPAPPGSVPCPAELVAHPGQQWSFGRGRALTPRSHTAAARSKDCGWPRNAQIRYQSSPIVHAGATCRRPLARSPVQKTCSPRLSTENRIGRDRKRRARVGLDMGYPRNCRLLRDTAEGLPPSCKPLPQWHSSLTSGSSQATDLHYSTSPSPGQKMAR